MQLKIEIKILLFFVCVPLISFSQFFEHEKSSGNIIDGVFIYKYENGNIAEKGKVKNGMKQGVWIRSYSDGTNDIYAKGRYSKGKAICKHVLYYKKNSQRKLVAHYRNYQGSSKAEEVREGEFIISYTGDEPRGIWKYYSEDGKLTEKRWYKKGKLIKKEEY